MTSALVCTSEDDINFIGVYRKISHEGCQCVNPRIGVVRSNFTEIQGQY
jgi:hypothetical protein